MDQFNAIPRIAWSRKTMSMRKNYSLSIPLLISAILILTPNQAAAQNSPEIEFQGFSSDSRILRLEYSIPYGGVVEIQLFDSSGKMVYLNRFVREEGNHHIPIRRTGFRSEESYSFLVKYKFSEISGEVPL